MEREVKQKTEIECLVAVQRLEAELEAVQEDESEQGLQNLMGNLRSRLAEIPDRMRWALNEVSSRPHCTVYYHQVLASSMPLHVVFI